MNGIYTIFFVTIKFVFYNYTFICRYFKFSDKYNYFISIYVV